MGNPENLRLNSPCQPASCRAGQAEAGMVGGMHLGRPVLEHGHLSFLGKGGRSASNVIAVAGNVREMVS